MDALVLTVNGGSSSLKFAIFRRGSRPVRLLSGRIERVGDPGAALTVTDASGGRPERRAVDARDHAACVPIVASVVGERMRLEDLTAIGHRVVHGGPTYTAPMRVTRDVLDELRRLSPLDPEHLPAEIALIEACAERYPRVTQIACFDTAFHHAMPRVAALLPIPRRHAERGVRRYGFHGLSYAYVTKELARRHGAAASRGRVIIAHLGNGASLAAVRDGASIDTSMAFTPAAGVPMSTRSGDLDPGLAAYLARVDGMTPEAFDRMVNKESGLLGVSETSADVRDLLERERTDARAADALALFSYQVKKWIGAFAAALGGLDMLVFTGGIGENAPVIRARIADGLGFLGVSVDAARNAASAPVISTDGAAVTVCVIPTDEEQEIAVLVCELEEGGAAR